MKSKFENGIWKCWLVANGTTFEGKNSVYKEAFREAILKAGVLS